ncbi:MAG TPA: hypothetical protein VMX17_07970 [Candidatus Glassbacteria bacterium]|nr:hypothetical protein [Candidatus Glassbacteria bacterium]
MEDRKKQIIKQLMITDSIKYLVENFLLKTLMKTKVPNASGAQIDVMKNFDSIKLLFIKACDNIYDNLIETVGDSFTLEEVERVYAMVKDPLFIRFNNIWMDKEKSELVLEIAQKQADVFVKEIDDVLFSLPKSKLN